MKRNLPSLFELVPGEGVLPIALGFSRKEVQGVLGRPTGSRGEVEYFHDLFMSVGYGKDGLVREIVLAPGKASFRYKSTVICGPGSSVNPLRVFFADDMEPVRSLGNVFFPKLGLAVSGYHTGDDAQRSVAAFVPGVRQPLDPKPIDLPAVLSKLGLA